MSLRRLDLGNNRIRRWDEVQRLALLPQLEKLWLEGNPVADIAAYRIKARGRLDNIAMPCFRVSVCGVEEEDRFGLATGVIDRLTGV